MTLEQFWTIVATVHQASSGDMPAKCRLLEDELRKLPAEEIRSFDEHFIDCLDRAYTWEMWAAAYIIGGGCSDDSFWDFRSTLISMGQETYDNAVADPESLADREADIARYEGFQYVAGRVYKAVTGTEIGRHKPHPRKPTGYDWEDDELAQLYPNLAKRYGWRG